jgi:hypothetical protein
MGRKTTVVFERAVQPVPLRIVKLDALVLVGASNSSSVSQWGTLPVAEAILAQGRRAGFEVGGTVCDEGADERREGAEVLIGSRRLQLAVAKHHRGGDHAIGALDASPDRLARRGHDLGG